MEKKMHVFKYNIADTSFSYKKAQTIIMMLCRYTLTLVNYAVMSAFKYYACRWLPFRHLRLQMACSNILISTFMIYLWILFLSSQMVYWYIAHMLYFRYPPENNHKLRTLVIWGRTWNANIPLIWCGFQCTASTDNFAQWDGVSWDQNGSSEGKLRCD